MRILEIEVENFRSLKHLIWRPDDLNVLIGPNAGGKTNVLRLFEFIKAAALGTLAKYVQRQGGMEPLVWDGFADRIAVRVVSSEPESFDYRLGLSRLGSSADYVIDQDTLKADGNTIMERDGPFGPVVVEDGERWGVEDFDKRESLLSTFGHPFRRRAGDDFRTALTNIAVYRELSTSEKADVRRPPVASFERVLTADGSNLVSVLHTLYTTEREFKTRFSDAMKAAFNNEFEELLFPPAADQRVQMRIQWRSLKRAQSAADISDGTLRFLMLLTVLLNPHRPPLIAIDEPETGLHPSMLSIVAELALDAARRTRVILATHSPELLDAFGGRLKAATVVSWPNGATQLEIKSGEELDHWLKEYTLGDLYRSGQLEN